MADTTEATVETTETTTVTAVPETDLAGELEKWKALSRQNEKAAKKLQADLEKAQQSSMSEQEKAVAEARAEGRSEAMKASTERLLRAEVRSLAAGLFADPADAVHFLDLDQFIPDDDGTFDTKAIRRALEAKVAEKPYLAAAPGAGSGEGGPRGNSNHLPLNGDPLLNAVKSKLGIN